MTGQSCDVTLRSTVEVIPSYKAGKRPVPLDGVTAYKVSSNENPYPPLPAVREVIATAGGDVNRYPDPANTELVAAIATYHGVDPDNVAVGVGAVALCYQLALITSEPGTEVIFAWRSFEAYPIVTQVAGAAAVQVPLTSDGRHDLDAMAAAVNSATRLIFVCSPNNPTGSIVSKAEFDDFMSKVPSNVLVVLDEAYAEFDRSDDAAHGIETFREYPNLVVLRTFSKAYGLAGLRVGFAVGHPKVIEALGKVALPFGVNVIASAAAVASLEDDVELIERVDQLVAERARVTGELTALGVQVAALGSSAESQANFIWLPLGERSVEVAEALEAQGLTVRTFAGEGLRITIGEVEANDRLIELAEFI
ncbi:MAG: histidinol-phosphate transaminase [Candidatus Nanopelagicales bacterium]